MADWEDYRFVAAVADAGTVRGAAKALGVHPSTVTRRLDQFERRLGVVLFLRSVRGLDLTAEGRQIVGALQSVGEQLQAVEQRLRRGGTEMTGEVRLSVSPAIVAHPVMAVIAELLAEFPALALPLSRRWTAAGVDDHEVDVAVVVVWQPPGDLIGRSGGTMTFAAWASRGVHARWPDACSWLPSRLQQEIAPNYNVADVALAGLLDTPELQLAAVRAGLGASLLPCYEARGDEDLVELPLPRVNAELWVLSHPDSRGVRRVQLLASRLADALRQENFRMDA